MNNTVCFNKRFIIVFIFIFLVIGFFTTISYFVNNKKFLTNSRASKTNSQPAVIGGKLASPGDYPFFVEISYLCGGSLIGTQWVLTAKHCVLDKDGNIKKPINVLVMTDFVNYDKSLSTHDLLYNAPAVEAIIPYEDKMTEVGKEENSVYFTKAGFMPSVWKKYDLNDIVLIKLHDQVDLPTISFPKSNWVIDNFHNQAVILGTGNIKQSFQDEQIQPGQELRYGELVIKPNNENLYNFKKEKDRSINERFLFASNVDSLSIGASGDSGGPIISDNVQKKIQVGIMHALNTNNYTVTVNNFIKVSYYSSWITRTTGIQPESGSWNGTLLPSTTRRTTTPSPTIPIPTPKEKPFCSGINRFCASLNKCEDYYDLTYGKKYFHENKNYKCYGNNKCCERNYITPSIKH